MSEIETEVLEEGDSDHDHEWIFKSDFGNYCGRVVQCSCGRVETSPAPGELARFKNMMGWYMVEEDGLPGMGTLD